MGKTKNEENVPRLEVVLVQCNLVDKHFQQKSNVLYTFLIKRLMPICQICF